MRLSSATRGRDTGSGDGPGVGAWPSGADEAAVDRASVFTCVLPALGWMPAGEIVLSAVRARPRLVLAPWGIELDTRTRELVGDATLIRFAGRPAGRALHDFLRLVGGAGDELVGRLKLRARGEA